MNEIRKCLALASILIGGVAVGVPDTVATGGIPLAKMLIAISTALNAASLYLLKEEPVA